MSTVVRQVKAIDLEGVLALYRELRPNDPAITPQLARETFAGLIQRDDIALLACDCDGVLTATCMLALIPNLASGARPFGVVEHVVTLPDFRRHGHARLVLEHALNLAWSKYCYKVVLLSGAQRVEAHNLYESVGFVGDVERGFVAKPPSAAQQTHAAIREG
jgi:GNAT superfamily N-acetyltransferase